MGNPKGRPKKVKPAPIRFGDGHVARSFEQALLKMLKVNEGGKRVDMTIAEAFNHKMAAMALGGNRLMLQYLDKRVREEEARPSRSRRALSVLARLQGQAGGSDRSARLQLEVYSWSLDEDGPWMVRHPGNERYCVALERVTDVMFAATELLESKTPIADATLEAVGRSVIAGSTSGWARGNRSRR